MFNYLLLNIENIYDIVTLLAKKYANVLRLPDLAPGL